eukprot:948974-Pelagomonas_calceolata.AAC.1
MAANKTQLEHNFDERSCGKDKLSTPKRIRWRKWRSSVRIQKKEFLDRFLNTLSVFNLSRLFKRQNIPYNQAVLFSVQEENGAFPPA